MQLENTDEVACMAWCWTSHRQDCGQPAGITGSSSRDSMAPPWWIVCSAIATLAVVPGASATF
jgi:hypothetical protein